MTYVSNACFNCRALHRRCNGMKPCSNCIQRNVECVYNPPTKRGPKPRSQKKEEQNSQKVTVTDKTNILSPSTSTVASSPKGTTSSGVADLHPVSFSASNVVPRQMTQQQQILAQPPQQVSQQQSIMPPVSASLCQQGVKSSSPAGSLDPLLWRHKFLEMISGEELPPPAYTAYNIGFYSFPAMTSTTSTSLLSKHPACVSTTTNTINSNNNTNTFNFNFAPSIYNIAMSSPSSSTSLSSQSISFVTSAGVVKTEPWTPTGHIVISSFLSDIGKLWPAQFAVTPQQAINYWTYLQSPTTPLYKMSNQLSDYPNLIDYAFYSEIFANGYRALRDEKNSREFAAKSEEALQRLSSLGFAKLTALAANKLVCAFLLAGVYSLTSFDLDKARSFFAQAYLAAMPYTHQILAMLVHRIYSVWIAMNPSPVDRYFCFERARLLTLDNQTSVSNVVMAFFWLTPLLREAQNQNILPHLPSISSTSSSSQTTSSQQSELLMLLMYLNETEALVDRDLHSLQSGVTTRSPLQVDAEIIHICKMIIRALLAVVFSQLGFPAHGVNAASSAIEYAATMKRIVACPISCLALAYATQVASHYGLFDLARRGIAHLTEFSYFAPIASQLTHHLTSLLSSHTVSFTASTSASYLLYQLQSRERYLQEENELKQLVATFSQQKAEWGVPSQSSEQQTSPRIPFIGEISTMASSSMNFSSLTSSNKNDDTDSRDHNGNGVGANTDFLMPDEERDNGRQSVFPQQWLSPENSFYLNLNLPVTEGHVPPFTEAYIKSHNEYQMIHGAHFSVSTQLTKYVQKYLNDLYPYLKIVPPFEGTPAFFGAEEKRKELLMDAILANGALSFGDTKTAEYFIQQVRAYTEQCFTYPDAFFAGCCAAMASYFVGVGDFQRATLLYSEMTRLVERLMILKKQREAKMSRSVASLKTETDYLSARLVNGIDIVNLYQIGLLWSSELCIDRMDAIALHTRVFETLAEYYADPAKEVPYYSNILISRVWLEAMHIFTNDHLNYRSKINWQASFSILDRAATIAHQNHSAGWFRLSSLMCLLYAVKGCLYLLAGMLDEAEEAASKAHQLYDEDLGTSKENDYMLVSPFLLLAQLHLITNNHTAFHKDVSVLKRIGRSFFLAEIALKKLTALQGHEKITVGMPLDLNIFANYVLYNNSNNVDIKTITHSINIKDVIESITCDDTFQYHTPVQNRPHQQQLPTLSQHQLEPPLNNEKKKRIW